MPQPKRHENISGEELYRRLAFGKPVVLIDVRTHTEFAERHIPGSTLIPLQDLESRVAELPNSGTPIALVCEHGLRSASACGLLAEHGFDTLLNLQGGMQVWPGPVTSGMERNGRHLGITPSSFLVESFDLLPKGLALDLAMGSGRNAIYLATRGFDVDGVDADPAAVQRARIAARRLGAPIRALVGNLEDGTYRITPATYDLIIVFNFLHRPMMDEIRQGVRPGGVVAYQTFNAHSAHSGPPSNPDYLLRPGELKQIFEGWEVLRYREFIGPSRQSGRERALAGIVARRPETGS